MAASARAITPTNPLKPSTSALNPSAATPTNDPTTATSTVNAAEARSVNSLLPNPSATAASALQATLSPKTPRFGISPRASPQPFTGAAAMAEKRRADESRARDEAQRMSPNPAATALHALVHSDNPMSRTEDAPKTTQLSEPLQTVAKSLIIPDAVTSDNLQTSPVSMSSYGSTDATTAQTVTAAMTTTAGTTTGATAFPPLEPIPSEENISPTTANGATQEGELTQENGDESGEASSNRAFTFPGPIAAQDPRAPQRGMSLPGYNQSVPRSPSTKRHKCPYCSTDFTRHHNLKSHLLTHSQEKPYECHDCHARFRRLHDLKRHSKLHTGERPHICNKCGRRFARGDALARHNKGQGGCAGRRSSFGMDEDMEDARTDDAMDGLQYEHPSEHEDSRLDQEETQDGNPRRISEPTRHGSTSQASTSSAYNTHGSTYPPPPARSSMGAPRVFPPPASTATRDYPTQLSPKQPAAGSSLSTTHFAAGQSSGVYSQGGMTESPKPLSPGQPGDHARFGSTDASLLSGARSPNMSQPMQPQHFSRGSNRGSIGLPPPSNHGNAPQLPQLPGLNPTDPRLMTSQAPKPNMSLAPSNTLSQPHSSTQPQSNPGSLSSHGASSGGSMREILGSGADPWAYIRDLEARFNSEIDELKQRNREQENRIHQLEHEAQSLRSQAGHQTSTPQQPSHPSAPSHQPQVVPPPAQQDYKRS